MTKFALLVAACGLLAACDDPTPGDANVDGAPSAADAGPVTTDAAAASDAPTTAPSELPAELLALETRGIAFADDGTAFFWQGGGGIHRARPPVYALERNWMPTNLGLHSELEVRGDDLYFIVDGALHRARIDAPAGVALATPLATGLDGMALASAPDGTLFYSKVVVVPVPGGGRETWRAYRLPPGGVEQELAISEDWYIGDVAWHDDTLFMVSLGRLDVRAIDLTASPPTLRTVGQRDGALVYGVAVDAVGRIYYADSRRAFRFDPSNGRNEELGHGFLLVENLALGRGPLDANDVYLAGVPNAVLRGAATAPP